MKKEAFILVLHIQLLLDRNWYHAILVIDINFSDLQFNKNQMLTDNFSFILATSLENIKTLTFVTLSKKSSCGSVYYMNGFEAYSKIRLIVHCSTALEVIGEVSSFLNAGFFRLLELFSAPVILRMKSLMSVIVFLKFSLLIGSL